MKDLLEMFDIETIFYGDFNINWADKRGRQKLKTMMSKFNNDQLIKKANKSDQYYQTLIDLIFPNRE